MQAPDHALPPGMPGHGQASPPRSDPRPPHHDSRAREKDDEQRAKEFVEQLIDVAEAVVEARKQGSAEQQAELAQQPGFAAENGDVILAAAERADAFIARQSAEALAVLDRPEISCQVLVAPDVRAEFCAVTQAIDFRQRQKKRHDQRAGTAQSRGGWKIACGSVRE